jgi:mono/diheme cytochrome c family protein
MLLALSTTSEIALGVMAGIFIVFSLISSFVLPARNPDFPGKKWRNAYLGVCVLLFVAMMGTVLVFGKEEEEAHATGEVTAPENTPGEPGDEENTGGEHETTPAETTPEGTTSGDPVAGKVVFTTSACGSCHVLSAANASGTIGPNLDETKPDEALIEDRVVNGKGAMPAFPQLTEQQVDDVVAFVHESTQAS